MKDHEVNKFYIFTLMAGKWCSYNKHFIFTASNKVSAGTARPTCVLYNKVMPYLHSECCCPARNFNWNRTTKQARRIVVLQAPEFHSLQKYQSRDKTSLYTTVTVWKLVIKSECFADFFIATPPRTAIRRRRRVNSDNAIIWPYQMSRKQRRWCSNEE